MSAVHAGGWRQRCEPIQARQHLGRLALEQAPAAVREQRVAAEQQALQDAADAEAERVRVAEENKRLQEQARQAEVDRQAAEQKVAGERRAAAAAARRAKDEAASKLKAANEKAAAERAARDKADRERNKIELQRQQERQAAEAIAASQANIDAKNRETIKCFVDLGASEGKADIILKDIIGGLVANVTMNY